MSMATGIRTYNNNNMRTLTQIVMCLAIGMSIVNVDCFMTMSLWRRLLTYLALGILVGMLLWAYPRNNNNN